MGNLWKILGLSKLCLLRRKIMGKSFVERNRIRRLQRARRLHRSMKAVKGIVSSAMSVGIAMATVWLVAAVLCG